MGRSTKKDWKQLKEKKEAEVAASIEESRRKAADWLRRIDKRKVEAERAIKHGEGEDHSDVSTIAESSTLAIPLHLTLNVTPRFVECLSDHSTALSEGVLHTLCLEALAVAIGGHNADVLNFLLSNLPVWQRSAIVDWLKESGIHSKQSGDEHWITIWRKFRFPERVLESAKLRPLRLPPAPNLPANPSSVATRPRHSFQPLNLDRLPKSTGIDGRTSLVTTGNSPDMGIALPDAKDKHQVGSSSQFLPPSAIPPVGNAKPTRTNATNAQFNRDPFVRQWALNNANGTCECCGQRAPFSTPDGIPFLEVHHIRSLSDGGSDTTKNTIAVCPNCHREMHYGTNRESLVARLYESLKRLVPE